MDTAEQGSAKGGEDTAEQGSANGGEDTAEQGSANGGEAAQGNENSNEKGIELAEAISHEKSEWPWSAEPLHKKSEAISRIKAMETAIDGIDGVPRWVADLKGIWPRDAAKGIPPPPTHPPPPGMPRIVIEVIPFCGIWPRDAAKGIPPPPTHPPPGTTELAGGSGAGHPASADSA